MGGGEKGIQKLIPKFKLFQIIPNYSKSNFKFQMLKTVSFLNFKFWILKQFGFISMVC